MNDPVRSRRVAVLRECGAANGEIDELLRYNDNLFAAPDDAALDGGFEDEASVEAWREYAEAARGTDAFRVLRERFPQLAFPVRQGMGELPDYRAATRRGVDPGDLGSASGLQLRKPERLRIEIHPTAAGNLPLLLTFDRDDFATLVRAFTCRNEPEAVPDSMGACIVTGYNNWDRVHAYRRAWENAHPLQASAGGWSAEFKLMANDKSLYQDTFLILSDGPYSSVAAADLGLEEETWRDASLVLRREHECAHYFCRRAFGSMRNSLHDELIADYAGIVATAGRYRPDWALRFLGLEDYPHYRAGGRLENYRGEPPLSDAAFAVLTHLVTRAAASLEHFDRSHAAVSMARRIVALTRLTVEEMASPAATRLLSEALETSTTRN